jgi:hypothetical protein
MPPLGLARTPLTDRLVRSRQSSNRAVAAEVEGDSGEWQALLDKANRAYGILAVLTASSSGSWSDIREMKPESTSGRGGHP